MVPVLIGLVCGLFGSEPTAADSAQSTPSTPAVAQRGMVATSEPLAVETALAVLKDGGNAIDAAVAAGAMIGLTEPMSCGIGGDLFAIVWDAKSQKLYGLNASGRSPYRATRELFAQRGLKEIPTYGPLSWSVPGCVDGWHELLNRFGTKSLSELLQPAIRTAENGYSVTPVIARSWHASEDLLSRWPDSVRTFMPMGHAPARSNTFRNPDLARTYRAIATEGRDAFYRGAIARDLVAASEK